MSITRSTKTRVELYTEQLDDLIEDRGCWANWEQAFICNCITTDTGNPNPVCAYCGGTGFRYLPSQRIKVGVSSFNSSVRLESLGLREPGTAYCTPHSDVIMGYGDRLTFPDFTCKYSEVLHLKPDLGKTSSKSSRIIKSVIYVMKDQYLYELDKDFKVSDDGYHLVWLDDATFPTEALVSDTAISILYNTTPSYLVVDLLHELRSTYTERKVKAEKHIELPKQYKITRELFKYDVNSPLILPDGTSSTS